MNVPSAFHIGGILERLIRTVSAVLSGLLQDHAQQLDDEALRTLLTEAENVVNSRQLAIDSLSDPDAPEPLAYTSIQSCIITSWQLLAPRSLLKEVVA